VFSLAGLAILIFSFTSNYSSINYYYEKVLLKQSGQEVQAEITNKHNEDFNSKASRKPSVPSFIIERDCIIECRYTLAGNTCKSESFLDDEALFNKLKIKQQIPLMVLPQLPETAYPSIKRLKNTLKMCNYAKIKSATPLSANHSQMTTDRHSTSPNFPILLS
jgi:hypothetical protein